MVNGQAEFVCVRANRSHGLRLFIELRAAVMARRLEGELFLRRKSDADGIYAISQICWGGVPLTFKNMTQMATTGGTSNFGADAAQRFVFEIDNSILSKGSKKTRPSTM